MTGTPLLLDVSGITKRFFGAMALDHAAFQLRAGEIHALIGENGAGKSTLIKILAGVYKADGGSILMDGLVVDPSQSPLPIAFVHQDLGLVDDLSVGENIARVAGYPRRFGMIDWKGVMQQADRIYHAMGIEPIDPHRLVVSLSMPEKAILGIVRSMTRTPKILVLDEPTASLPEADAQLLFEAMRRLRNNGTSIIYVSHRLGELFGLVDRVTVFRDGKHIETVDTAATSAERLVERMLGRSIAHTPYGQSAERSGRGTPPNARLQNDLGHAAPPALSVQDLVIEGRGPMSFQAYGGEILGLVGLRGGGQEAAGRAIFGALPGYTGQVVLEAKPLRANDRISDRIAAGIVLLAGDRTGESTFTGMSLTENLFPNPSLGGGSAWSIRSPREERERCETLLAHFDVRPRHPEALIDWLSGGNQQKVCIARWLEAGAKVVVLEEPTAGVDIGAKLSIHETLRRAASTGAAIIVVSSDLEEVAALCDRALVVDRGRIASELRGDALTMDELIARSSLGGSEIMAHVPVGHMSEPVSQGSAA